MRVPTMDPYPLTHTRTKDVERRRKHPKSLRPGLFYMFGERGKYAAVAGDSGSEEIELAEIKGERRQRKPKSPKSPKSPKTPKLKKAKPKIKYIQEPIQTGDTVQRVALRYGVPVSGRGGGEAEERGKDSGSLCRSCTVHSVLASVMDDQFLALSMSDITSYMYLSW